MMRKSIQCYLSKVKPSNIHVQRTNYIWLPDFDIHRNSPVEILHTVLLGVIKYAWGLSCAEMSVSACLNVFEARLRSLNVKGLNIDPVRAWYLVQYRGSLIGRNFKTIVQTIAFVLYGLVSDDMIKLWVAAGHMVSLIWYPEIQNITIYCVSILFTIGNMNFSEYNTGWASHCNRLVPWRTRDRRWK